MDQSQQFAAHAVCQVLAGHNLTQTLEQLWRRHPELPSQQRAAIRDLSHGALRHYGESQAALGQLMARHPEDLRVQGLLLVALYQLVHGRAAAHAVVDHAVRATTRMKMPWAKGVVNGVLRNFLRQREVLLAAGNPDDTLCAAYPAWWVDRLQRQYPQDWRGILAAGNQHPPMTLRVNLRRTNPAHVQSLLDSRGLGYTLLGQAAIMLTHPVSVEQLPGFAEGLVSVQDAGAQWAALLLDLHDGQHVLDACCAPGGKTGHMLECAAIDLAALDNDAQRLQRVKSNLGRLGSPADLYVGDAACSAGWWDGRSFDRVLADVPCSASGIVRRHVDIRWLRRESDLEYFAMQQAAILDGLWPLLKNGGKLLYATCSVFAEENQDQIDGFLRRQADARQMPLPGLAQGQLIPCNEHDGFFYALLEKV